MTQPRAEESASRRDLLALATWTGLAIGLVEGAGWLIAQRLGRLTHVWTDVLWIAPTFDAVIFIALGAVLGTLAGILPRRWRWPLALFTVGAAAAWNFVSLTIGPLLY